MQRRRVHVRGGRAGRELIVDGTFASFYRPGAITTGSVWDAIAAPLLGFPSERLRDVLVLGLGGGSAARIVRALAPAARIVGVELDREVIEAARRHLDLDALDVELVQGDALAFLRAHDGRYDAVLEDVFVGEGDAVHKPAWIPAPGLELAARRLRPNGVLVSNTLDEAPAVARALSARFASVVSIDVADYDNRIFAAGRTLPGASELRAALRASPVLRGTLPRLRLRTLRRAAPASGAVSRSRPGTASPPR